MAKLYLETLLNFINQLTFKPPTTATLECKHFFSGAALYVNNSICLTLTPEGLALKLPETQKNYLLKNKVAIPLQYFPKSPVKKDYALFPQGISNDAALLSYINGSITYIATRATAKETQQKN